jgi:hypothetical protein
VKFVHLVGFIIRIHHDARSYECLKPPLTINLHGVILNHGKNFTVFTGDPTHLKDQSFVVGVSVALSPTEKSSAQFRASNVEV